MSLGLSSNSLPLEAFMDLWFFLFLSSFLIFLSFLYIKNNNKQKVSTLLTLDQAY